MSIFMIRRLVAVALVAAAAGCQRDQADPGTVADHAAAEVTTLRIEHDGTDRVARLYVPASVTDPAPLVLALHGGLGSGPGFADYARLDVLAEREGFVAVYPDGLDLGKRRVEVRTWNAGRCCGPAAEEDIDDVGFLVRLVDEVAERVDVDRAQLFALGHSNGGMLAWRLACEHADVVAAIVAVGASLEYPECAPASGVSVLAIHGDADRNHPLEGGVGARGLSGVDFTSMSKSFAIWTAANGCADQPLTNSEGQLETTEWTDCRDDTIARLVVVEGADHAWPGSEPGDVPAPLAGQPSDAIDATEAAWEFLASDT